MKYFTIVLPIRDTDEEYNFMKKTLKPAFELEPGELLLVLDKPSSERIVKRAKEISKRYNPEILKIIEIEKTNDWNFHLAHLMWEAYQEAKFDKILSVEVDSILSPNVLLAYDQIGKNNLAVVSFTKRLKIKTLGELIRYRYYRIRVSKSEYVFTGVFWVYRPFYFKIVSKEKLQKIINGVDTILTEAILSQTKYKILTRKEIGVKCLTMQNNDYPWRQYQTGVWFASNIEKNIELRKESRKKMKKKVNKIKKLILRLVDNHPFLLISIIAFRSWHPHMITGFLWARKNPNSKAVIAAKSMTEPEWSYLGAKYVNHKKWKFTGTGYD